MTRINWNGHDAFITYLADRTELYTSQEKLNTILKNIPGGLASFHVTDHEVIRTYISEGALSVLGYAKDEPVVDDVFGSLHRVSPEERVALVDAIRVSALKRLPFNMDIHVVPRSGAPRWVNLVANPVEMDGQLYFYGIYSDVTAQKSAKEAALAERERQIAEYQRELRQLSATQSEDLLAKLSLDLTDGALESGWIREGTGIRYDDVTEYEAVRRRMADSCLTAAQRDAALRALDRTRLLAAFARGENETQIEFQRRSPSGRLYWVSATVKLYMDPECGHLKVFLYSYDIDSKKTTNLLMERLLSLEAEMLGVIDVQTGTLRYYRSAQTDFRPSPTGEVDYAQGLAAFTAAYVPENGRRELRKKLSLDHVLGHLSGGDSRYSYSFWADMEGQRRRKSCTFTFLDDSAATVILIRSDTTDDYLRQEAQRNELDAAHSEVERARLDGVTEIYNRVAAEELIARKLSDPTNGRCAFLLLDLDDLKKMNDRLGHPQGDRALRAVAATLKKHFRRSDIFGRIGGDEFVAFLTGITTREDLDATLRSLLRELLRSRVGEQDDFVIHCSIGCALGECGRDSFADLYKQADTALYHVKRNGKNSYVFYSPQMQSGDYIRPDHAAISLRDELAVNRQQLNQLMGAISSYYPMVISVNLTQDRYFLMESSAYVVRRIPPDGSFHQLMELIGKAVHPEDREIHDAVTRDSLLAIYDEGKSSFQYRVRLLDPGSRAYHRVETTAVFYKDDSGDVCTFIFSRLAENPQQA